MLFCTFARTRRDIDNAFNANVRSKFHHLPLFYILRKLLANNWYKNHQNFYHLIRFSMPLVEEPEKHHWMLEHRYRRLEKTSQEERQNTPFWQLVTYMKANITARTTPLIFLTFFLRCHCWEGKSGCSPGQDPIYPNAGKAGSLRVCLPFWWRLAIPTLDWYNKDPVSLKRPYRRTKFGSLLVMASLPVIASLQCAHQTGSAHPEQGYQKHSGAIIKK